MSQFSPAPRVFLRWLTAVTILVGLCLGGLSTAASAVQLEGGGTPVQAPASPGSEGPLLGDVGAAPAEGTPERPVVEPENAGDEAAEASRSWVATGAAHALDWALRKLDPGSPSLLGVDTPEGNWFTDQYGVMRAMGIWVMVPLLLIAIIHAITKGSMEMLLKSVLIYLPISILGSVVAVEIIDQLLKITDDISEVFANSIVENDDRYWRNIYEGLKYGTNDGAAILSLVVGLFMLIVCVTMYVILLMREASIYIATAFLPVGFAMMVWPTTLKYFRKLCEFLFAMIFSKVIIVAGVSLAVAGIAGTGTGYEPTGTFTLGVDGEAVPAAFTTGDAANQDSSDWVFQSLQAIVMLAIVCFTPTMLVKLAGNVGFDGASGALESMLNRPGLTNQIIMAGRIQGIGRDVRGTRENVRAYRERQRQAPNVSIEDQQLQQYGFSPRDDGHGNVNYYISEAEYQNLGFTDQEARDFSILSQSQNPNEVLAAQAALRAGSAFGGMDTTDAGYISVGIRNANGDVTQYITYNKLHDAQGRRLEHVEPTLVRYIADRERARGQRNGQNDVAVRIMVPLDIGNAGQHTNMQALTAQANLYRRATGAAVRVVANGDVTRDIARQPLRQQGRQWFG